MALDPFGLAIAILVTQEREVTFFLLSHDHITIGEHEQATRMLKAGRESRDRESFGRSRPLIFIGQCQGAIGNNWP